MGGANLAYMLGGVNPVLQMSTAAVPTLTSTTRPMATPARHVRSTLVHQHSAPPQLGDTGAPVPALVQLSAQAHRLRPELVAVMEKVNEVERHFDQCERDLKQQREEMERVHEEHERALETEKQRLWEEVEQEKQKHESMMRWEKEKLQQEIKAFEELKSEARDSALAAIGARDEVLTIEVGGDKFRTSLSTLARHPDSNLLQLAVRVLKDYNKEKDKPKHIFIDRDSKHFKLILNFLRQGEEVLRGSSLRGADRHTLHDILCEARYYQLTELEHLIQRHMITLDKPIDLQHLITTERCFTSVRAGTTPAPKYITTKSILLKEKNLTGITFDRVHFKHSTSFEGSVLAKAKFKECFFEAAINFTNADLYQASFDHCEGVCFGERILLRGANMTGVTFNPPLDNDGEN